MVRKYDTRGSERLVQIRRRGRRRKERRTKKSAEIPVSKLLRDNGHSEQRRCRKKSPKLAARGLVGYIIYKPRPLHRLTKLKLNFLKLMSTRRTYSAERCFSVMTIPKYKLHTQGYGQFYRKRDKQFLISRPK